MPPLPTTVARLELALSDPVEPVEIARLLDVSLGTVYTSLGRFDRARRAGDEDDMRRHIPCLRFGGVEQDDGSVKGGRFRVPRDSFIRWYSSTGLADDVLERLWGEGAA